MDEQLRTAVLAHSGHFECVEIHAEENTKSVPFRHITLAPDSEVSLPNVRGLAAFYSTFNTLRMYFDEESGESAFYIGSPSQWDEFRDQFESWIEGMDDDEMEECVPSWAKDCLVVGEVPRSGNYLLVATSGPEAGSVFEFEHDGFEFIELADSLPNFVHKMLAPKSRDLTEIASHMRFIVGDCSRQWWIKEMRDNKGRRVKTKS